MKKLKFIHQGDVLLIQVDELPSDFNKAQVLQPNETHGIVLHHGEALGHFHKIKDHKKVEAKVLNQTENVTEMALLVKALTNVTHEEHGAIQLPAGTNWIVRTQRESFQGLTRRVVD